jgi:CRP/FNR family transcriptional regulator, anaerobic regulatory protein
MKEEIQTLLRRHFPVLGSHPVLMDEIAQKSTLIQLQAGQTLLQPGSDIHAIPLVVKGAIKVVRPDHTQHEVLLYHIQPGQSCAMTLSSCLRREASRVKAVTLQNTVLIGVPSELAYALGRRFPAWFDFVLESYSSRFDELLNMVEAISFESLEQRLIHYLQEKSAIIHSLILPVSHKEIAAELGASREVVSRLLKQMEHRGQLQLFRGRIKILGLM